MKHIVIILGLVMSVSYATAQDISISEAPRAKENGTYNSYLFELPDVSKEEATKNWNKYMASYKAKTKYNRKSKLHITEQARIPSISDQEIDVYARILEDKNPNKQTSVIVWFDLGDEYMSSDIDELKAQYAYSILTEYALITSKYHAKLVAEGEEKRLGILEKELEELKRANKNYHKDIEKAKESIDKNEKNIEINVLDQKNKEEGIQLQREIVEQSKAVVKRFN